jgi:two-component system catabolic regulation response regulator CreB
MHRVLVVEDELAIADTLLFALRGEGFAAQHITLAGDALHAMRAGAADLIILDVGLPDMTGFEACKALRQFSSVPVMFLTARAEEIDRVVGLEIGADDYVVKPFSPREVVARVRAILKRSILLVDPVVTSAEFKVDVDRLQIHFCGHLLKLTALQHAEFQRSELELQRLVSHPEQVVSREQLLAAAGLPAASLYERNVDTHIKALRGKLREVEPGREPLQTHRGFGYSYTPHAGNGLRP